MAAPILQGQTMPATSVTSADATAAPVSDYSLTSRNAIDEIRRPDGSVQTKRQSMLTECEASCRTPATV